MRSFGVQVVLEVRVGLEFRTEGWRNGGMDDGWICLDTSSRMQSRKRVKVKNNDSRTYWWPLESWYLEDGLPGLVSG